MKTNCLENTLPQVKKGESFTTVHYMAEFYSPRFIEDEEELEDILFAAARASNNTPLKCFIHKFPVCGITGIIILAESHIAVHTWPDHDYMAIDVFTCGKESRPQKALDCLRQVLTPKSVKVQHIKRGIA